MQAPGYFCKDVVYAHMTDVDWGESLSHKLIFFVIMFCKEIEGNAGN